MLRLAARVGLLLLPALSAQEDEPFEVSSMLRSAAETYGLRVPAAHEEARLVAGPCVPEAAGAAWRGSFDRAVETMLQKTKRAMQHGLAAAAQSVIDLLGATTCGDIAAFRRLGEQASRLHVLATSRSLAGLDRKVMYEPLKALTVGGIDVHEELNALIIAWQYRSPADKMGKVLMEFFSEFSGDEEPPEPPGPPPEEGAPEAAQGAPAGEANGRHLPGFWVDAANRAFAALGDSSAPVKAECLTEEAVHRYGQQVDTAFKQMMEKTRRGIQAGLLAVSRDTLAFLDAMEARCGALGSSAGAQHLRSAASRLHVLAGTKNLINPGVHVEYEAMKGLKVGGIDVHIELNLFIGAWLNKQPGEDFGERMANFFRDFKEEEESDEKQSTASEEVSPYFTMLRDAFRAAQADRPEEELDLPPTCLPEAVADTFAKDVNGAIGHMLQKRKRTMQQGLKELADATDRCLRSLQPECIWSTGAKAVWLAAKKLGKLTRSTVVDYGTYIKYEAMKSLEIGGVAVHAELNQFLAAWKFHSVEESGTAFGFLMKKLSQIKGHDEL